MDFNALSLPERLLIARRGTAYFAQNLGGMSDEDLMGHSLLHGWTRKHVLAHVAYNAAALCRLMNWAATGIETPMYESAEQRDLEIREGAALSGAALRNLLDRNVVRLDEKWRHLAPSVWDAEVRTAQGRLVRASETVWMRTREVWIHAVDLDNGGRFGDFPALVLDSLLTDIVGAWQKKDLGAGLVLKAAGRPVIAVQEKSRPTVELIGPLVSVVRWAAGRGAVGLANARDLPEPPRWL